MNIEQLYYVGYIETENVTWTRSHSGLLCGVDALLEWTCRCIGCSIAVRSFQVLTARLCLCMTSGLLDNRGCALSVALDWTRVMSRTGRDTCVSYAQFKILI